MGYRGRAETLGDLLELLLPWGVPDDLGAPNSLPLSQTGLEDLGAFIFSPFLL